MGHIGSFVLAFTTISLITRAIGLEEYGRYVLNLILLAAVTLGWNLAVREAAAAELAKGASQRGWDRHLCLAAIAGSIATIPLGGALGGITTVSFIILALIGEAASLRAVPSLIARGGQQRIAFANVVSQAMRLVTILALWRSGALTPDTALLGHIIGYICAAIMLGSPQHDGTSTMPRLWRLVPVDALKWCQSYLPILGAAYLVGLRTAGGFDLILRLVAGISLILSAVGPITLPKLAARGNNMSLVLLRSLRVPSLAALVAAAVFGFVAETLLTRATGQTLNLDAAPIFLAGVIAFSPWIAVMRTTLLVLGRSAMIIMAQAWISALALAASLAIGAGVNYAALLLAFGSIGAALLLSIAVHREVRLPRLGDLISPHALAHDLRALMATPLARIGRGLPS